MCKQPFFSVIIPTYNRRRLLRQAVDSVLGQTYRDLELIVIDDGSTDGTSRLMGSYDDERLIYRRSDRGGVSRARNLGLSLASGRFIAFLDSDDRWTPEKLEVTSGYIERFPGIRVFHTDEVWYRRGKLLIQKKKHAKPDGLVYGKALPLCCISISTAVVKDEVFEKIGGFDEDLEACEDYDFWLRVTASYEVRLIRRPLTLKDGGREDQLSQKVWGLDRFRIRALEKMLASGTLPPAMYDLTLRELQRKCSVFASGASRRGRKEEARLYRERPLKYARG